MLRVLRYIRKWRSLSRAFSSNSSSSTNSNEELDRIDIKAIKLFGYHGVLPEEKQRGQNFLVDTTLFLCLKKPGLTDNLAHSVNYASVYEDIEQVMNGPSVNLVEHLAEIICHKILEEYPPVKKVQVSIRKPEAPLPCPRDSFETVGPSFDEYDKTCVVSYEAVRSDFDPPKKRRQCTTSDK